jgi:hypothetical protein
MEVVIRFRSSRAFIIYFFQDIMDICYYNDKIERVSEMRRLISVYKKSFQLDNYSNVSIWRRIKKLYNKDWDYFLAECLRVDSSTKALQIFISENIKSQPK